ncbi:uncharacterized protein [Diadema antillarum]|uniref:uncharacterized protein n=1 Tax=Diadema antillarum TaxID=105358 RepID=UPI003A88557F
MTETPTVIPPTGRAILWMTPRMISTAFAKCMSGIADCEVWFEPFVFCHVAAAAMVAEGIREVPMSYEGNEREFGSISSKVAEMIASTNVVPERLAFATIQKRLEDSPSRYVFSKDESIAMFSESRRQYLPKGYRHAFIIRHPRLVYDSFRKAAFRASKLNGILKYNETEDTFDLRNYGDGFDVADTFRHHHDFWQYIRQNVDPSPLVISSEDLLNNPEKILPKFCEAMGYPYSESLLSWNASPDVIKTWKWPTAQEFSNPSFLDTSIKSTHFVSPKPVPAWEDLTEDIREMAKNAMPFYEEMYIHRLIV